jgi:hypothetical protein
MFLFIIGGISFFSGNALSEELVFSFKYVTPSEHYTFPTATLANKDNKFQLKIDGMNQWQQCLDRLTNPKVTIQDDFLIISPPPKIKGCEEVRFVFSTKSSKHEGQILAKGNWIFYKGISEINLKTPELLGSYFENLQNNQTNSTVKVENQPKQKPPQENSAPRAAAIGNVDVPVKAPVGQGVNGQPTQLTTNPIDQQKKTSNNEIWVSFNPSITVQERQFCRIIENFRVEKAIAEQSKNQIKINETFKSLVQSLNSLLPDGKFQGWIMRTVYVAQASDGSAEVLLELPCNVYVGSNACDADPQKFYGTAPEGTRMYTELAKMSVGDFALTSGQFVYVDDKAFDKNRSVASFRYLKTASHCRAQEMPADTDFFGLKLDVISTMK